MLAIALLAQPLYASWIQVRLLQREDTRVQARAWIEEHVPASAVLGTLRGLGRRCEAAQLRRFMVGDFAF